MKTLLLVLAILAALAGVVVLAGSEDVFEHMAAGVAFLVAAVAVGFASVTAAIDRAAQAARFPVATAQQPRPCDGCGQLTAGVRARVIVDGEEKHVCAACVAALRSEEAETAKSA